MSESSLPVDLPEDKADKVIDFMESIGCRVEIWQQNIIRQWFDELARCRQCSRPTDGGERFCAICRYQRANA